MRRRSQLVPETGCILWTGCITRGYGTMQFGKYGHSERVHRVAYRLAKGAIPKGLVLDHLRACINPDHLEPVTVRENIMRGESFVVAQAKATHCKRGHAFSEANTVFGKVKRRTEGFTITRACRRCRLEQQRARRKKEITEMAHKTKQGALKAARDALGPDSQEGFDFNLKNGGAGWDYEEIAPANAAAAAAQAKRVEPKAPPKKKARFAAKAPAKKKPAAKAAAPKKAPAAPAKTATPSPAVGKGTLLMSMLLRSDGATSKQMEDALGWKAHSVRGYLGTLRAKGVAVVSTKAGTAPTVYSVAAGEDVV